MAEDLKSIDISGTPEVLRLVEEVRRAGEPRILRRNDEDLAVVTPLSGRVKSGLKKPTAEDYEAFRSAVGSWSDIDPEALIEQIYRWREEGTRPSDRP